MSWAILLPLTGYMMNPRLTFSHTAEEFSGTGESLLNTLNSSRLQFLKACFLRLFYISLSPLIFLIMTKEKKS